MGVSAIVRRRAVFLDRDGVLNQAMVKDGKPFPPKTVDKVEILPGVLEGLQRLRAAGFLLIVITNQPDVSRGTTTRQGVETINHYLAERLPIDRFMVCYHDRDDGCSCRKPRPGMLLSVARDLDVDLASSYLVGDRWSDIEAGKSAGCKTIFLDRGYLERQPVLFDHKVSSFGEAVDIIAPVP